MGKEDAGRNDDFEIDSAGTHSYHIGNRADRRMRAVASQRGYQLDSIARRIQQDDFENFDLIVVMDDENYYTVNSIDPGARAKVVRMCTYSSSDEFREVPDPYYGGDAGFFTVLDILEDACTNLLRKL
jgi:protein-tyrosine phosphatase